MPLVRLAGSATNGAKPRVGSGDIRIMAEEVNEEELESLREIYAPSGIVQLPNTASDLVLDNIFIGER